MTRRSHSGEPLARRRFVKELISYLLQNLYLDFQGDVSMDTVRDFLREDDSKEARALTRSSSRRRAWKTCSSRWPTS